MTTLAGLLSGASLEVVVPSPSDHAAPPPPNLDHDSTLGQQEEQVDEWARELLGRAPRTSLYRDEVVDVYLALSIPVLENNLDKRILESALTRARQEGHLIGQLELDRDGASATLSASTRRTGSLAFPALRVDTAAYTTAPRGADDVAVVSEGVLKPERWWLARVEARYMVLWHFAGCPRGVHGTRENRAAFAGCVRLSHDCPLSETPTVAQDDVYLDEDPFDEYSIGISAYSTAEQYRSTAVPASSRPHRADSFFLLPTPLLRTAELTLLVVSPLSVDMRVIPSPLGDGAILAIEMANAAQACDIVGLRVRVDARANHAPRSAVIPPMEARSYGGTTGDGDSQHLPDADRPLHLAAGDRFARLFSLRASAFGPEGLDSGGAASSRDLEPLPIEVMTSPSQHFNSRFSDNAESNKYRAAHQRMASTSSAEPPYRITVKVSVRMQALSASVICSEWYNDLDSASIARDAPRPLTANFHGGSSLPPILPKRQHPSTIPSNLPPSPHAAAIALISARAAAPSQSRHARDSADSTACQAFAGSYQYTRKGLASSAVAAVAADGVVSDARAAPRPTSVSAPVATPQPRRPAFAGSASPGPSTLAATGPKRFFSLPPAASAATTSMTRISSSVPRIGTGEMPPDSGAKSSSLPFTSAAAAPARPTNSHRKSWMSGLVSKSPAPSSDNLPISHGETQAGESHSVARSESISTPPIAGTSWDTEPVPTPRIGVDSVVKDRGKVVVSVSLVPLRQAKSRRPPAALNTSSASTLYAPTHGDGQSPSPTSPFLPHRIAAVPPPQSPTWSSSGEPTVGVSDVVTSSPNTTASATMAGAHDPSPTKLHQSPRVNVLDIFLVDVFVLNQTNTVKHYLVRAPPGRGGPGASSLGVVPLETDIEIGPLAPDSCAACALRFLALRSGSHEIERIQLVDLAEGTEMVLEKPVIVVVE